MLIICISSILINLVYNNKVNMNTFKYYFEIFSSGAALRINVFEKVLNLLDILYSDTVKYLFCLKIYRHIFCTKVKYFLDPRILCVATYTVLNEFLCIEQMSKLKVLNTKISSKRYLLIARVAMSDVAYENLNIILYWMWTMKFCK